MLMLAKVKDLYTDLNTDIGPNITCEEYYLRMDGKSLTQLQGLLQGVAINKLLYL